MSHTINFEYRRRKLALILPLLALHDLECYDNGNSFQAWLHISQVFLFCNQSNVYLLRCVVLQANNLHVVRETHFNRIYLGNTYRNTHFILLNQLYVHWQMNTIDIININTVYIYIVSNIQTAFQGVGAGGEVGGANRGITAL